MTFDWRFGTGTVVGLWLSGTVISGLLMFFFGPKHNYNWRTEWKGRLIASLGLNLILWPFFLTAFMAGCWRRLRKGKRPTWLVYADDENNHGQWTLSDGTEFLSSAHGGCSRKPCSFLADYMSDEMCGEIQFRVRLIAPTSGEVTNWQSLSFTADPKVAEDDEEPDDSSSERYEGTLLLPRGKYAVEFRAQNRAGVFEEHSGVTMIVADDSDYD